jgi:hypothetical protein
MKRKAYPVVLEEAGVRVTIRKRLDHGRPAFRIEYQLNGMRKSKDRADEAEAHNDAARILTMLLDRAPVFAQTEDAAIYRTAQAALSDCGVPVDVATRPSPHPCWSSGHQP